LAKRILQLSIAGTLPPPPPFLKKFWAIFHFIIKTFKNSKIKKRIKKPRKKKKKEKVTE